MDADEVAGELWAKYGGETRPKVTMHVTLPKKGPNTKKVRRSEVTVRDAYVAKDAICRYRPVGTERKDVPDRVVSSIR